MTTAPSRRPTQTRLGAAQRARKYVAAICAASVGASVLMSIVAEPASALLGSSTEIVVSTFAGGTGSGYQDGPAATALFNQSPALAVDGSNNVYVADQRNHRIRKIGADGQVTTLAGSGAAGFADGQGMAASFNLPTGVAVDGSGNVFVADQQNNRIRKVSPTGLVSTLAGNGAFGDTDGPATSATFGFPYGVAVDSSGVVYSADRFTNRIRKIDLAGTVTTVADGTDGLAAPTGVAVDNAGHLYVANQDAGNVLRIDLASGVASMIASDMQSPNGVAVDSGSQVFVVEQAGHRISRINPSGTVDVIAGSSKGVAGSANGPGNLATFTNPYGIALDSSGDAYVAEQVPSRIRKISNAASPPSNGFVEDDGSNRPVGFECPRGTELDGTFGSLRQIRNLPHWSTGSTSATAVRKLGFKVNGATPPWKVVDVPSGIVGFSGPGGASYLFASAADLVTRSGEAGPIDAWVGCFAQTRYIGVEFGVPPFVNPVPISQFVGFVHQSISGGPGPTSLFVGNKTGDGPAGVSFTGSNGATSTQGINFVNGTTTVTANLSGQTFVDIRVLRPGGLPLDGDLPVGVGWPGALGSVVNVPILKETHRIQPPPVSSTTTTTTTTTSPPSGTTTTAPTSTTSTTSTTTSSTTTTTAPSESTLPQSTTSTSTTSTSTTIPTGTTTPTPSTPPATAAPRRPAASTAGSTTTTILVTPGTTSSVPVVQVTDTGDPNLRAVLLVFPVTGESSHTVVADGRQSVFPAGSRWELDFGDGRIERGNDRDIGSVHTYAPTVTTTYRVVLTIIGPRPQNLTTRATRDVTVSIASDSKPTAVLETPLTRGISPADIGFTIGNSTAPAGRNLVKWTMNFGDGRTASGPITAATLPTIRIQHTFGIGIARSADYTASLVVTDDLGIDSFPSTLTISVEVLPLVARIELSDTQVKSGDAFSVSTAGTTGPIASWKLLGLKGRVLAEGRGVPPKNISVAFRFSAEEVQQLKRDRPRAASGLGVGSIPGPNSPKFFSNGCGPQFLPQAVIDVAKGAALPTTFIDSTGQDGREPKSYAVNFEDACHMHDAAYSAALIDDIVNSGERDTRNISLQAADQLFESDLQAICRKSIPEKADVALRKCLGGASFDLTGNWAGVQAYRGAVGLGGWAAFGPYDPVWFGDAVRAVVGLEIVGLDGTQRVTRRDIRVSDSSTTTNRFPVNVTTSPTPLMRGENGTMTIRIPEFPFEAGKGAQVNVGFGPYLRITNPVQQGPWICKRSGTDLACFAVEAPKKIELTFDVQVEKDLPSSFNAIRGAVGFEATKTFRVNGVQAGDLFTSGEETMQYYTDENVEVSVAGFVVDAGPDASFPSYVPGLDGTTTQATITLDGSNTSRDMRPQTFKWTQISGPSVRIIPGAAPGEKATFIAPRITNDTKVSFQLDVSVLKTDILPPATQSDKVEITLLAPPPGKPVIITLERKNAPVSRFIAAGTRVTVRAIATVQDDSAPTANWNVSLGDDDLTPASPFAAMTRNALGQYEQEFSYTWPASRNGAPVDELRFTASVSGSGGISTRDLILGEAPSPLPIQIAANKTPGQPAPLFSVLEVNGGDQVAIAVATPAPTSEGANLEITGPAAPQITLTDAVPADSNELNSDLLRANRKVKVFTAPRNAQDRDLTFTANVTTGTGTLKRIRGTTAVTVRVKADSAPKPVVKILATGGQQSSGSGPLSANDPDRGVVARRANVELQFRTADVAGITNFALVKKAGPDVTLTSNSDTNASYTFMAPDSDTTLTFEVTGTRGPLSAKTTFSIIVGAQRAPAGPGCGPDSVFNQALEWVRVNGVGTANSTNLVVRMGDLATVNFGDIAIAPGIPASTACAAIESLSFTGGSFTLLGGFLSGDNVGGVLEKGRVCFSAGQVSLDARLSDITADLSPNADERVCISLDPAKWASAAQTGNVQQAVTQTSGAPRPAAARKLEAFNEITNNQRNPLSSRLAAFDVPACTPPPTAAGQPPAEPTISGTIRWVGLLPGISSQQLEIERGETVVGFSCGGATVGFIGLFGDVPATAAADDGAAPTASWLAVGGVGYVSLNNGSPSMEGKARMLGAKVNGVEFDVAGDIAFAATNGMTWNVQGNADLPPMFDGALSEVSVSARLNQDGFNLGGRARIHAFSDSPQALDASVDLAGGVDQDGLFFAASGQLNRAWPTAPVGNFQVPTDSRLTLDVRFTEDPTFRIGLVVPGRWRPTNGVEVSGVNAVITNVLDSSENTRSAEVCPITDRGIRLSLNGSATVNGASIVAGAPSGTATLGGCASFSNNRLLFQVGLFGVFDNWRPIAGQDFRLVDAGLILQYDGAAFAGSIEGRAIFQGIDLAARVSFSTEGLLIDAAGGFTSLGLPIASGHLIVSTYAKVGYVPISLPGQTVPSAPVDLEANTLILLADLQMRELDPNDNIKELLMSFGLPEPLVPQMLRVIAKFGPTGFSLEAQIRFPGDGFTIFEVCGDAPSCIGAAPGVITSLKGQALTLKFTSSGTIGIGAQVQLQLPGQSASEASPPLELKLEASFNPINQTIALSLSKTGGPWLDALGIQGLNLGNLAIQGGIQIVPPPGVPIPTIGFGAEVLSLPPALNNMLGIQTGPDGAAAESMRLAVNIAPTAPILAFDLGREGGATFMKPLQSIAPAQANEVQVDYAKMVIAPLGGSVGPFTFEPGLSLGFAAVVAQVPISAKATLTLLPAPSLYAEASVGDFRLGSPRDGVLVENANFLLDVKSAPPTFKLNLSGGVDLPPSLPDLAVDVKVDVETLPAPKVEIGATASLRNWEVFPNVARIPRADFAVRVVTGDNASLSLDGNGQVVIGSGADASRIDALAVLKLDKDGLQELRLSAETNVALPGLSLSGPGCAATLGVVPSNVPAPAGRAVPRGVGTQPAVAPAINLAQPTGACMKFAYVRGAAAPIELKVAGTAVLAERTSSVLLEFGARGATLRAVGDLGPIGWATLNGDYWLVDNVTTTGRINPTTGRRSTLTANTGDFRIEGAWSADRPAPPWGGAAPSGGTQLLLSGSSLTFSAGQVGSQTWVQGSGTLKAQMGGEARELATAFIEINNESATASGSITIPNMGSGSLSGTIWLVPGTSARTSGPRTVDANGNLSAAASNLRPSAGDFTFDGRLNAIGSFTDSDLRLSVGKVTARTGQPGSAWMQATGTMQLDGRPLSRTLVEIVNSRLNTTTQLGYKIGTPQQFVEPTVTVRGDVTLARQVTYALSGTLSSTILLGEFGGQRLTYNGTTTATFARAANDTSKLSWSGSYGFTFGGAVGPTITIPPGEVRLCPPVAAVANQCIGF